MTRAPWWKRTTVYQLYPRSFSDSNADGIGDLKGLVEQLPYLEWLGVETLWLTPFFASPHTDYGYDVSAHYEVAPEYGTLADLRVLIDAVHARGMKVMLDLVLNLTSMEHAWFRASRSSKDDPHRDFYIWRKGAKPGGKAPPNNWLSMLGGSGWHYDAATDEWYWATFLHFQPDLNWRNPAVKTAMLGLVRHWLEEGIDGLRLDLFNAVYKDASFRDNPRSLRLFPTEQDPDGFFQRALYTQNHPDTVKLARELRAIVDEYSSPARFLVGEIFAPIPVLQRYCGATGDGLNLVFLFNALRASFSARGFRKLTADLEEAFPEPLCPSYVFGNHDRPRATLRLHDDPARARLLAAFQLTVRGVPFIYYGEELGLPHPAAASMTGSHDPVAKLYRWVPRFLFPTIRRLGILLNRDEARSPMPWNATKNAGFSAKRALESWLPTHPEARRINVETERDLTSSVLSTYRRMLHLRRRSAALSSGSLELVDARDRHLLAYRRKSAHEEVLVVLNFSSKPRTYALADEVGQPLRSSLHDVEKVAGTTLTLAPWEALVVGHVPG